MSALHYTHCGGHSCSREGHAPSCQVHAILEGPNPNTGRPYAVEPIEASEEGLSGSVLLYGRAATRAEDVMEALNALHGHTVGANRVEVVGVESTAGPLHALTLPCMPPASSTELDDAGGMGELRVRIRTRTPWATSSPLPDPGVQPPSDTELLEALYSRWAALSAVASPRRHPGMAAMAAMSTMTTAGRSALEPNAEVHAVHVQRFSSRSRRRMIYHGVEGEWTARLPWRAESLEYIRRLFSLLPFGGRTSFGFGHLEVEAPRSREKSGVD